MKNNQQTKQRPPAKAANLEPIRLYRADLFQDAREKTGESFRDLASQTKLAKQTIQDVVNGDASKLDPIFVLAKHFGIDWLELFDVNRRIRWNSDGFATVRAGRRGDLTI